MTEADRMSGGAPLDDFELEWCPPNSGIADTTSGDLAHTALLYQFDRA